MIFIYLLRIKSFIYTVLIVPIKEKFQLFK